MFEELAHTFFNEKIVLITGSSGQLGVSYQELYLNAGAVVIALDIKDVPEDYFADFKKKRLFVAADVTSKADLQLALQKIQHKYGNPDILINNAALD